MEVEERREFLQQMNTLGKQREYQQMINQEIADVRLDSISFLNSFFVSFLAENSRNGADRSATFESVGRLSEKEICRIERRITETKINRSIWLQNRRDKFY